jgi:hypothetical protein
LLKPASGGHADSLTRMGRRSSQSRSATARAGHGLGRGRAMALKGLAQAECMRGHGITRYPSPGALDGGLHEPDATAIGLDTHTLRFAAAARACGMAGGLWQAQWWWPAGLSQP